MEREAGYTSRHRSATGKGEIPLKSVHGYPSQLQKNVASMPDVPQSQPSCVLNYPPATPRTIIIEEDKLYDLKEYEERQPPASNNQRKEVWEIVTPAPVVATRSCISDAYERSVTFDPNRHDAGRGYPERINGSPKRPKRHDLNRLLMNYVRTSSATLDARVKINAYCLQRCSAYSHRLSVRPPSGTLYSR